MSQNRPVNDTDILAGFASLHQAMAQGFDGVNRRLDRVEERLTGVEGRLTSFEGRLSGVERRLDGVDVRLNEITNDIARLEHRMLRRFD
jgi:archaellum component FlaC